MAGDLTLRALKHVWGTLAQLRVPMAVMGGLAVAVWQHIRATRDVDLLVEIEASRLDMVLDALSEAGIQPKRKPPILVLGDLRIIQLLYEPPGAHVDVQVDLLLAESEYHREALSRRIAAQLPGIHGEVSVLACEDLILHKLLAGRMIDKADAAALLSANRQTLDMGYLLKRAKQLAVVPDLDVVWEEAFPGEPLPS